MKDVSGLIALVTGASREIGKGIARELAASGATVYATGRSIASTEFGKGVHAIRCDQRDDDAVARVFDRIASDHRRLDVLVNAAWAGYDAWSRMGASPGVCPSGNSRCGDGMP